MQVLCICIEFKRSFRADRHLRFCLQTLRQTRLRTAWLVVCGSYLLIKESMLASPLSWRPREFPDLSLTSEIISVLIMYFMTLTLLYVAERIVIYTRANLLHSSEFNVHNYRGLMTFLEETSVRFLTTGHYKELLLQKMYFFTIQYLQ